MFHKFTLKNGLKILLIESHKSPVLSMQMWVKTGSADESKGQEGLSHFIEHLLFKGTRKFEVGEIASNIEGSGGELNAFTSFDQTVFYITISKNFAGLGLEALSDMMGFPQFDAHELDNEREVVMEEIRRNNDNPQRQAAQALFSTLYKKHPYGVPVIGYEDNVRNFTREQVTNYYHSRYVPENMTLLVAGDFEPKTMKKEVRRYFGEFDPYPLKKVKRRKEVERRTPKIHVESSSFEESLVYLAWPVPSAHHRDIPALDMLALILGQGDSSRLVQSLRLQQGLVNSIGAGTFTPQDRGFFAISMSLSGQNLEKALELVNAELSKVLSEPPVLEEMKKAKLNLNGDDFYSLETVEGMANKYGTFEHLFGDYKHFREFTKQINKVTAKELRSVARRYLRPEKTNVVMTTPGATQEAEKTIRRWLRQYKKDYSKAKVKKSQEEDVQGFRGLKWFPPRTQKDKKKQNKITQQALQSGARVIFRPNYDTPVVSLRCAFLGGLRDEPFGQEGLTELLSRTWISGTPKANEQELNRQIDGMASSLSAFAGRNTVGLSMMCLSPFMEPMFNLLSDILTKPRIDEHAVEREKAAMTEQIKHQKDNPAQLAFQGFLQKFFGEHPYSKNPLGTKASVEQLSTNDVKGMMKRLVSSNNMTIALTGNFQLDEWKSRLEEVTKNLPEGASREKEITFSPPAQTQRSFQLSDKEQAHVILGYPGLTFKSPQRHTLQILQSILAGQGGRLFLELRDKASLAYTVAPVRMEGVDGGYFGAYIGCSPDKVGTALEMLQREFSRLTENKVLKEELERAKRYIIGRHDIELQRNGSVSNALLFDTVYGLDPHATFNFAEHVKDITPGDVQSLAQSLFSHPPVISVVGPENPWEEKFKTVAPT